MNAGLFWSVVFTYLIIAYRVIGILEKTLKEILDSQYASGSSWFSKLTKLLVVTICVLYLAPLMLLTLIILLLGAPIVGVMPY